MSWSRTTAAGMRAVMASVEFGLPKPAELQFDSAFFALCWCATLPIVVLASNEPCR
jgi:hypothetical protein